MYAKRFSELNATVLIKINSPLNRSSFAQHALCLSKAMKVVKSLLLIKVNAPFVINLESHLPFT